MAKKELSPEMRIVLAFGLSLLILISSRFFLVRETPPTSGPAEKSAATASSQGAAPQAERPSEASEKKDQQQAVSSPAPDPSEAVVQGQREELVTVVGDLYRVV